MINKYYERLEELETILNTKCEKYEDDCNKCPYRAECEEWLKLSSELDA